MKVAVVIFAVLAAAHGASIYPASTQLYPAPQFDSAVIQSDRLGGNFAYSSVEAKAYQAVTPVVQNVISPVGVSYTATPIQYPAAVPALPAYAPVPAAAYAPVAAPGYPVAPLYPAAAPAYAPLYQTAAVPVYPAAPVAAAPAAIPVAEEAPVAPAEPSSDAVEAAASNSDSVTIEAA